METEEFSLDSRLWKPQVRSLVKTMSELEAGKRVCLFSPTGSGKCLAPNTPVMMHNGRVVRAVDVAVGDDLMGPDSKPRRVLSTCRGVGPMYRVTPTKGTPYEVNDAHILTLKMNCEASGHKKGELVDISIMDYLSETKTFRHCAKGVRTGVDFPEIATPSVSPYFVGVWLGDGTRRNLSICLSDQDAPQIIPSLISELSAFAVDVVSAKQKGACSLFNFTTPRGQTNPLLNAMRDMGLSQCGCGKFIPDSIKYGSREARLDVLAGVIDTDGHLGQGFDLVFKDESLANDVAFVARSLGLACYVTPCHKSIKSMGFVGEYFRLFISGNCEIIPCRVSRKRAPVRLMNKDVLNVGISVEPIGEGEYAGFVLDGDGRFLLGDFTITHNTIMAIELLRWAQHRGVGGVFFVNRKLLIQQTSDKFTKASLPHAIRAAEFDDLYDDSMPFQISSADSERARVYKSNKWNFHEVGAGGLVIVDEAHIQKSQVMEDLLFAYKERGAMIVLLTATPVEMGKWADTIVVGGKLSEWRACGALVPVYCYSISQPDLTKVKRNATGEYVLDDRKRKIFTQHIVGEVIENWERLTNGSPTMAYAPGVPESVWLTQEFNKRGHNFAHVDATKCVVDGVERKLDRVLWSDIMSRLEDGSITGLFSRFKAREGIDLPRAGHCVLATPVGSIASYLQIVGRVMRSAPGKENAILQDHGGVYHHHGSPNHDRNWESLWKMKESVASNEHMDRMREGTEKEPIRCPSCGMERTAGPKCPGCGLESTRSLRKVVMESGVIKEVEGDLIPKIRRIKRYDTEKNWAKMYFGFKRKGSNQTFSQMEAFFSREYGYRPRRDLPFMPIHDHDWKLPVKEVTMDRLRRRERVG